VSCGGCIIEPEDIILGDADGVVVIPRREAERIIEIAGKFQKIDNERLQAIRKGKKISELPSMPELYNEIVGK